MFAQEAWYDIFTIVELQLRLTRAGFSNLCMKDTGKSSSSWYAAENLSELSFVTWQNVTASNFDSSVDDSVSEASFFTSPSLNDTFLPFYDIIQQQKNCIKMLFGFFVVLATKRACFWENGVKRLKHFVSLDLSSLVSADTQPDRTFCD